MPLGKGQTVWGAEVGVTDARPVRVNLRAVWAAGQEEPWYLATNLGTEKEVRGFYRQRMRIEQAFRDGKSHFKVGALKRWKNREHGERMLAVLTLVLLFVAWLALRRLPVGWSEQQQVWGALSYVNLVLAYIDEQWNQLLSPPGAETETGYLSGGCGHIWKSPLLPRITAQNDSHQVVIRS